MTKFLLTPAEFTIPTLSELRSWWCNIPNADVQAQVVVEAQYLAFQKYLLSSLQFELPGWEPPRKVRIGLSVRAGAVKTANLLTAAIIEAVLRVHAERRGYKLPPKPRQRTFGKVLEAWQNSQTKELIGLWPLLWQIHDFRNTAHLHEAADTHQTFYTLLDKEQELLNAGDTVLAIIRTIQSA